MSAVKITTLPAGSGGDGRGDAAAVSSLAWGLGAFIFVAASLFILLATTFPFDFAAPAGDIWLQIRHDFDTHWVQYDPHFIDRGQNILFFMPFGFGLASIITGRGLAGWIKRLAIVIPASAMLSGTVETLQTFVSFRDPSLMDIWCNTLGGSIGAAIYCLAGEMLLRGAARGLLSLRPLARPPILAALLVLYALPFIVMPLRWNKAGNLAAVWDQTMPLLVGNELGGERGWNGSVSEIFLADRAATDEEINALARGAKLDVLPPQSLIAHYQLGGKAPFNDATGTLPPLDWAGDPAPIAVEKFVMLSPENWLKTRGPVTAAIHRITQASQFTFGVTASTFDINQSAPLPPKRIAGLSAGPSARNLQIGQDGHDLVVRVRTVVRSMPDLYIRNVFADDYTHNIVVTEKEGVVIVYIDGDERGRCEIIPEAKLLWPLYPHGGFRLRLERYGFRSYAAVYRAILFIPFAALLGATLMNARLRPPTKRWIAIGVILGFTLLLEMILGAQMASGFQTRNLLISLVLAFGTLGALTWWHRHARTV